MSTADRLSEDRLRAVIRSIADAVIVADKNGRLQLFNRAAEEMMGYGLLDSKPVDFDTNYGVFLEDGVTRCPADQLPLTRAIRGDGFEGVDLVIRNSHTGHVFPIEARATPIRNEAGELTGGVVVFHDTTHQKDIEAILREARDQLRNRVAERTAELRTSRANYRDLYDNAPDMFATVDVKTGRILQCNRTLVRITGYTHDEIVGRDVLDLYAPESVEQARHVLAQFVEIGEVKNAELKLRRKDDGYIDVSLNVSALLDPDGTKQASRLSWRDITSRRMAEEKVREQRAQLTHVSRLSTLGEMAAGLAHEINQPLAAIAAYAAGASVRLGAGTTTETQLMDIFDRIAADALRAGEVIRRLRQFVRKRDTQRTVVNVNQLVEEVQHFVLSEANQQQITLELKLASNLPNVSVDEIEIQQVLLNLIRNAFDALVDVEPSARAVTVITSMGDDRTIEVAVHDAGPGISPHLGEQVFEAFYTSKTDGLGMGLAISRSIIETHGGRIWIGDGAATGATVHFSLPSGQGDVENE